MSLINRLMQTTPGVAIHSLSPQCYIKHVQRSALPLHSSVAHFFTPHALGKFFSHKMAANAVKQDEFFYGATLTKNGATITWDPKTDESEDGINLDRLHIRQILLGHTAKENQYNVVEVETVGQNDSIKIPIAVLKAGETRVIHPELEFPYAPVTFTLIEGDGPVYIVGQQVPNHLGDDGVVEEYYDEDEEALEEEDDEDDIAEAPAKKPKLENSNKKANNAQKKK